MIAKSSLRHLELLAIYGLPVVWAFCLMTLFNATSPLQNGPFSVLIAFVLMYLLISSALYMLLVSIMGVLKRLSLTGPINKRLTYYLTSVIALGPVFLLALNTLNQIELKDIALVVVLISLGCFYVIRRSPKDSL
jgi:hypothetical protein